jgi:hypothetical protein
MSVCAMSLRHLASTYVIVIVMTPHSRFTFFVGRERDVGDSLDTHLPDE